MEAAHFSTWVQWEGCHYPTRAGLVRQAARGPTKGEREAYALGQKNKEVFLHGGEDVINPYWPGDQGYAYQAGETDRAIPQWDPHFGGPQPDWWDPNPID